MQSLQMSIPVTGSRGKNDYAARFYGSGLGWTVLDYRGRKFCDHAGSAGTMIAIMPEERIGVVVLTNVGWSNLSGMLMYDVFDAYLLGPDKAWDRSKWDFWM
jgi:CubicO group peptidase (beta-lactamase class C family)